MDELEAIGKIPGVKKLAEITASGIGSVAGAWVAPWVAGRQAKVRLIEARAAADSMRIIAEAQADAMQVISQGEPTSGLDRASEQTTQRLEYQERKRQSNLVSIVSQAAEDLGEGEVPDQKPDHDWIARYFEYAKDVSDKDVQKLWAKVLAGTIRAPESISLRALSTLRDMTRREAELFKEAMRYRVVGRDFVYWKFCVESSDVLTHDDFYFRLVDMGLFYSTIAERPHRQLSLDQDGKGAYVVADRAIFLQGQPNRVMDTDDNKAVLKPLALELASLCDGEVDWGYLRRIAKLLHDSPANCSMQAARLIEAGSQGFSYDSGTLVRVDPMD